MGSAIANFFIDVGSTAADTGSKACVFLYLDEAECPKSLIKWLYHLKIKINKKFRTKSIT